MFTSVKIAHISLDYLRSLLYCQRLIVQLFSTFCQHIRGEIDPGYFKTKESYRYQNTTGPTAQLKNLSFCQSRIVDVEILVFTAELFVNWIVELRHIFAVVVSAP